MNRKKFLKLAGGAIIVTGTSAYLLSDKSNFTRKDIKEGNPSTISLQPGEKEILSLASMAPSGHNTQPWLVKYLEPYHWIIGNDKSKWLPAVDPAQRETILSIGAFMQNFEYAANNAGYDCRFDMLAGNNQDENVVEVKLLKTVYKASFDIGKIKLRRTVRSNYLSDILKKEDAAYLFGDETGFFNYIPNTAKEHTWLNEQTIEANRIQAYRDDAQKELSEWIRFSSKDAAFNADGLTTASMEINGMPAWILRNFYGKPDVLKKSFREQSIDKVVKQVGQSAGWILITSKANDTLSLLETGKRMQRLFLKVRDRNIAIHPMTQVLEEPATAAILNSSIGISDTVQFILRTGYLKDYPDPVSLRRPVEKFVRR
jgi:hypothetical protein